MKEKRSNPDPVGNRGLVGLSLRMKDVVYARCQNRKTFFARFFIHASSGIWKKLDICLLANGG